MSSRGLNIELALDLAHELDQEPAASHGLTEIQDDTGLSNYFQGLIERLGYSYFIYSHLNVARETIYMICCTYPDAVRKAWSEAEIFWRDPLIPHLIKSTGPIDRSNIDDDMTWSPKLLPQLAELGVATPAWQFVVRDTTPFLGLFTIAPTIADKERLGPEHYQAAELVLPSLCIKAHETWRGLTDTSLTEVPRLSNREAEILELLSHGKSTEDISALLTITERTVNYHVGNLKTKMGVETRAHAVAHGMRLQLI